MVEKRKPSATFGLEFTSSPAKRGLATCFALALGLTHALARAQTDAGPVNPTAIPSSADHNAEQPPVTAYPAAASTNEPVRDSALEVPSSTGVGPATGDSEQTPTPPRSIRRQLHLVTDTGLPTLNPHAETVENTATDGSSALAGFNRAEGAFLRSSDDSFRLRMGALLQTRLSASTTSDPSRKFEVAPIFARVYWQGNVGDPWLRYFVQTELVGQQSPYPTPPIAPAPRLLDAWVEAQPVPWFGVRLGAMRPVFTRSWIVPIQKAVLFDRTEANAFFRTHGPLPQASAPGTQPTVVWDRDVGLQVSGAPFGGAVEYALGAFNGNGFMLGRNGDPHLMPVARLAINPLGPVAYEETTGATDAASPLRIQLGAAAYQNRYNVEFVDGQGVSGTGTEEQKTIGADLTVYGATVHFSAEAYLRSRRTVSGERHQERGIMATLGWMFFAPYAEMATRVSLIDPRVGTERDVRRVYDVELNYYHLGNNAKLGLRYSLTNNQMPSLGGAPGLPYTVPANETVHTGSLVTQLYF